MNFGFLIFEKANEDVDLGELWSALNEIYWMKMSTYAPADYWHAQKITLDFILVTLSPSFWT